jgi:hypothetical protein
MRQKIKRPHIPWTVREQVIDRQIHEMRTRPTWAATAPRSVMVRVKRKLEEFFCGEPVELHHRPALCNRETHPVVGYVPHANDPEYLVYLPVAEHDIETRVRGQHGAHSDLALARKRKRAERKKTKRKHEWPKRTMRAL